MTKVDHCLQTISSEIYYDPHRKFLQRFGIVDAKEVWCCTYRPRSVSSLLMRLRAMSDVWKQKGLLRGKIECGFWVFDSIFSRLLDERVVAVKKADLDLEADRERQGKRA